MYRVRIHGRGGQGVVTAAELLARAAFRGGRYAQAIPSFGSERTGAPVVSYCRIDDGPIRTREPIAVPDAVVVQDSTLLAADDPLAGLADGGVALVNTWREASEISHPIGVRVVTVPADAIVMEHLGAPKPSVAMLAALTAVTDMVALDDLLAVVAVRFTGRVADGNIAAARAAHAWVASHAEAAPTEPREATSRA